MELELSQKTIDAIAYKAATIVVKKLNDKKNEILPEMVTTKEAAAILKITPGRMRQIAARFPHIKQGENKQSKLLFVREALLIPEKYKNF